MKEKKKFIVKALSCVAKICTINIPSEYLRTMCDEGIDGLADIVLDVPENMPTLQKYKDNSNEKIVTLVDDLISSSDYSIDPDNIVLISENELAEMIMKNNKALKWHEDIDIKRAKDMLVRYLCDLKEWAVKQPQLCLNSFEVTYKSVLTLKEEVRHQKRCYDRLEERVDQTEQEIHQLSSKVDSGLSAKKIPDIWSYDVYTTWKEENRKQFYQYFLGDPSISVDTFFWSTNYKLRYLDEDCDSLQDKLRENGLDLDTAQIIELIDSNPLVLLTGLYGTGKTTLLKRLHFELVQRRNERVVYLHAKDVLEIMYSIGFDLSSKAKSLFRRSDMDAVFENVDYKSKPIYVFIDELDELNKLIEETTCASYLSVFSEWLSNFLSHHHQFRFVLSSRVYAQIGKNIEQCVADTMFLEYYSVCNKALNVICTECFDKETRNSWIEEYASHNNRRATYTTIKKEYGKVASALNTPIFLYAFMQKYISGTCDTNISGYYYYYSHFIEKTVGGKFDNKRAIEKTAGIRADRYHLMLQKLAYDILQYSEDLLTKEIYGKEYLDEQLLLGDELTKRKFEIPLARLAAPELPFDSKLSETANSVNCFFLKMDKSRVYFTDTNILFSLASEYVYGRLEELLAEGDTTFQINHLSKLEIFYLYPHLVDYIVYLAKQSPFASELYDYLDSFVTNPNIKAHTVDLSKEKHIDRILLLYILFLKTHKDSYNTPKHQHVIKEIIYYVNAYKTVYYRYGNKKPYAIERYFMKLKLHHVTLRRINFRDYNFQGSVITDKCRFHQCKFQKTNMYGVVMDGSHFTLCEFNGTDEVKFIKKKNGASDYQAVFDTCEISNSSISAQSVLFRNCKIDGLVLEILNEQRAEFENCFIKKITISPQSDKSSGIPQFTRCIFENDPTIKKYKSNTIEEMLSRGKNIRMKR